MNLGIVADEIDRNFTRAVQVGTALGIRRYEIRHLQTGRFPNASAGELREIERVLANEDIGVTAISPGLFKLTDTQDAFDKEMSETYPRCVEWAHRRKLRGLIVFGFHKPGATEENASSLPRENAPPHAIEWLREAAERATADGLLLMVEPEPICWETPTGIPGLAINYDPGNVAWLIQRDPLDEFAAAAPYIANVHVKDLLPGSGRPTFVPAGEGMIDWRAHFKALQNFNYNGPISLEPHMDGSYDTIQRCIAAIKRLY